MISKEQIDADKEIILKAEWATSYNSKETYEAYVDRAKNAFPQYLAEVERLQKENERFREALKYYAYPPETRDDGMSEFGCGCCAGMWKDGELDHDYYVQGRTARTALGDPK